MPTPTTYRDYYDLNPPLDNAPGDVWSFLPTQGLLPIARLPGMVVTAACDLANRKVETVTYLPILPLTSWFKSLAALPELRRIVDGQWQLVSSEAIIKWPDGFLLPASETLMAAEAIVVEELQKPNLSEKVRVALKRVQIGFSTIRSIATEEVTPGFVEKLRELFGEKDWEKTVTKIITNAYRSDLHFLPADAQPAEWSGLSAHSVVLFRYPITIPFEILDAAQDLTLPSWTSFLNSLLPIHPMAASFKEIRPMKRLRVRTPFISDLIARYTALNIRLGSPDFTQESVARMCKEV